MGGNLDISRTVSDRNGLGDWKVRLMPALTRRWDFSPRIERPP